VLCVPYAFLAVDINFVSVLRLISNFFFSAVHLHLNTSEADGEDEDVAYERRRVSSGDADDDVLVLQDLTKVREYAFLKLSSSVTSSFDCVCCIVLC